MALAGLLVASVCRGAELTMVVCAPGYPGSTAEAQPAMDGLAGAVADAAGWERGRFGAEYFETEQGGLDRLAAADAGLGMFTLPFFLEHRAALDLRSVLMAVPEGRRAEEPWTLVAGTGTVKRPQDLDGWTLVSLAGYSEAFVRGPVLGDWGRLPDSVQITFSSGVLTALRRAARGDQVAVLLDAEQAEALPSLPFAGDLEVVHRSRPLPVSVVCSVDDRVDRETLSRLVAVLEGLGGRPEAAGPMAGVRIERFEPLDEKSLAWSEKAFDGAAE